jgi:uncharacterized membrane protein YdbT with pleckstrin-like domain
LWVRAWAALLLLGIVIIGIVIFVRDAIYLLTTEIVITDRRLINKTGLIARRARELELDGVESVEVEQSVWGRLLGYGTIEVHGTGDDIWIARLIADPVAFRRELSAATS